MNPGPTPMLPLLAASALLLAPLAVPWLRPLWVRVAARLVVFVALTLLVQAVLGSPLQPRFAAAPGWHFWGQVVEAGWWWVAAGVAAGLARLFVVLEHRPRETRIVSDLIVGAIGVATLLAIVNFAFEVPIRGLLATSGVIAIVLGLALQSTLSDVFSGVAVGLERPYKPGDLLWVEGGIDGTVVQVNWRSTRIATGDGNIAIVPNSVIAKARLVNRSAPTPVRRSVATVVLDPAAAPDECLEALTAAALSCRLTLPHPPPAVACTALGGDGMTWEVAFSTGSDELLLAARTELLGQIQRHLRHGGIALARGGGALPLRVPAPDLGELLERSDLFGVVTPEERASLLPYFRLERRRTGETLIREGDEPEAMFLILSGAAEITRQGPDGPRVVYRMSPGETLGAIGLITARPYAVTATALTALKAFRIGKADIAAAIRARPEVAAALEELARRGQDALQRAAAASGQADPTHPEMFLTRLRGFLRLLAS